MTQALRRFKISGSGVYLPKCVVSSSELALRTERTENWKCSTSEAVKFRYFASALETQSYMAVQALQDALEEAGMRATDLDLIISASASKVQPIPCSAAAVHRDLGLEDSGIPCFDVDSTCLSFLTALDIATLYVSSGEYNRIAIVTSEIPSAGLNWQDAHSSFLFGDGAAAFIIEASDRSSGGLLAYRMATFSSGFESCQIRAGGTALNFRKKPNGEEAFMFEMDGKAAFRLAAKHLDSFLQGLCSRAGILWDQIDLVVPHQASPMALSHIQKRLGMSESKLMNILHNHGNQVAASIPIAWHMARKQGRLQQGNTALLVGTSAGISLGGALVVMP